MNTAMREMEAAAAQSAAPAATPPQPIFTGQIPPRLPDGAVSQRLSSQGPEQARQPSSAMDVPARAPESPVAPIATPRRQQVRSGSVPPRQYAPQGGERPYQAPYWSNPAAQEFIQQESGLDNTMPAEGLLAQPFTKSSSARPSADSSGPGLEMFNGNVEGFRNLKPTEFYKLAKRTAYTNGYDYLDTSVKDEMKKNPVFDKLWTSMKKEKDRVGDLEKMQKTTSGVVALTQASTMQVEEGRAFGKLGGPGDGGEKI
jgi:hypothetical protein